MESYISDMNFLNISVAAIEYYASSLAIVTKFWLFTSSKNWSHLIIGLLNWQIVLETPQ